MLTAALVALLLQLGTAVAPPFIQGGTMVIAGRQQVAVAYYQATAAYCEAEAEMKCPREI